MEKKWECEGGSQNEREGERETINSHQLLWKHSTSLTSSLIPMAPGTKHLPFVIALKHTPPHTCTSTPPPISLAAGAGPVSQPPPASSVVHC